MADVEAQRIARGTSSSRMRAFACKDCQREASALQRSIEMLEQEKRQGGGADVDKELKRQRKDLKLRQERAMYNENWAEGLVERGGSRSDRCKDHRQTHRKEIQGLAVAYIDFTTVGEVTDRQNPTGPLGGLGPLPDRHEVVPNTTYDLQNVKVGMTDEHITEMISLLRSKQVLILRAGTGTGKSTFVPYRLMDPPPESLVDVPADAPFGRLTELGQIIVTEPRVQATVGVATFVGGTMSGLGVRPADKSQQSVIRGVGPGYPVGYQVSGDRNHDEACELVYVTDGTMINWLRDGRLSRIGTVIVDEAHERSTNIDFILGYLKRELPRYPHLRVIVTSATFNSQFYQEYFGGPDVANVMEVPAEKAFGYGMPLFPELDAVADDEPEVAERWSDDSLPLSDENPRTKRGFITKHWPPEGPPFDASDVKDESEIGDREDVRGTTEKLFDLRYQKKKIPIDQWREQMPEELTEFVIDLAKGLDREGIFGDILGFLPTAKTIEPACEEIARRLGSKYRGHVFRLISSLPKDRQLKALAKRRKGDPRKIVISTNLAETSLTVEGVRFIVDSGIIAQSEWDSDLAKSNIPTKAHSQAGIKQRWGRVGRKAPGWVFPLYTKGQYLELAEDTPPGSTRENLEALVMTAKMGGIDDVVNFPWPAAFEPTTTELDESAVRGREAFRRELVRADAALRAGGALDEAGHPTSFGKELVRFQVFESTGGALAVMYADRLACVPEVTTILALLEDTRLIGDRFLLHDDREWPDEWRLEAAMRHRALAGVCEDDAHLALLIMAAWERADRDTAPWEPSWRRKKWARQWFVNNDVLLDAADKRRKVLGALSPAMKEEVKRFVEPALVDRARGVITRALAAQMYRRRDGQVFASAAEMAARHEAETQERMDERSEGPSVAPRQPERTVASLEDDQLTSVAATAVIALRRRQARDDNRISNLVTVQDWAIPASESGDHPTGVRDAMRMVVLAAKKAAPDPAHGVPIHLMESWPVGQRVRLAVDSDGLSIDKTYKIIPPFPRPESAEERGKPAKRRGYWIAKRRRASSDAEEPDATRADSDGEINPIGSTLGFLDEDQLDSAAFAESDLLQGAALGCGHCFPCVDGRDEDCEHPVGPSGGKETDPLQSWLDRARHGVDVSEPRISVEDEDQPGDGWYEIVGYSLDAEGSPGIRVRRDWHPDGFRGNPAQHPDVVAGQRMEVTVGPMLRHHSAELRTFNRVDGQGRFLVRDASHHRSDVQQDRNELATALDPGARGLLADLIPGEQLTATVVPARVDSCYTITLLELLHQHLEKAAAGRGYEHHVLDKTSRNASRAKVYQAVIASPANEHGYATAVLLHQDFARGIKHRFDFNVLPRRKRVGDEDETRDDGDNATGDTPQLEVGEPVLLNLRADRADIDVGGLDLDALEKIERESIRGLRLRDATGGDDAEAEHDADLGSDEEQPPRVAAAGAVLRSTSADPVTEHAVKALIGLNDSPDWQNDVWAFWARSHHRRVDRKHPYLPGCATEPIDVRSEVQLSDESSEAKRRRLIVDFERDHAVGTDIEADVETITDHAIFVKLTDDLDGKVPVSELSWSVTKHPKDEVALGDTLLVRIIDIDLDRIIITLSARSLLPKPYEQFKQAQRIGDTVVGVVRNSTDSHVYISLCDGVDGVVFVGELAHYRIDKASDVVQEGQELTAAIKNFNDDRNQVELSVKPLLSKLYDIYKASHEKGDVVEGRVRELSEAFVFVSLPDRVDGAIHISNLSEGFVKRPSDVLSIGQLVRAAILEFDDGRARVKLSLKDVPAQTAPRARARTRPRPPVPAATSPPRPSVAVPTRVSRPQQPRVARGEGKTVQAAVDAAAAKLGLAASEVRSRTMREPVRGLFGRVKTLAQVEVTER